MNDDESDVQAILVLHTQCSTNSPAKSLSDTNRTQQSGYPHLSANLTQVVMDPASLPLWCDLTVLPEIPWQSADETGSNILKNELAAKYLRQQEFHSCGNDNLILLENIPLMSSKGILVSLSSCQTRISLNSEDSIFVPVQAIPSTFLIFLEDGDHYIVKNEAATVHANKIGDLMELEVKFDFTDAVSLVREMCVGGIAENKTMSDQLDDNNFASSQTHVVAPEASLLNKHEELLRVIMTLAEKEARELNQMLSMIAAVAVVLIGVYCWLIILMKTKKRRPNGGKKARVTLGATDKVTRAEHFSATNLEPEGGDSLSQDLNEGPCLVKGLEAGENPRTIPNELLSPCDKGSANQCILLIQRYIRMKIACAKTSFMLSVIIQLQSIIRGYLVRRQRDHVNIKQNFGIEKGSFVHLQFSRGLVHNTTHNRQRTTQAELGDHALSSTATDLPPPLHSISFDHSEVLIDISTEEPGYVLSEGEKSTLAINKNDYVEGLDVLSTDVRYKLSSRLNHVADLQHTPPENPPLGFALELKARLQARRLIAEGANSTLQFELKAQASASNRMAFGSRLVPCIGQTGSPDRRQLDIANSPELSPLSKIAAHWNMSKETRRKNRRPSSARFIAQVSDSQSSDVSMNSFVSAPMKVPINDFEKKVLTASNPALDDNILLADPKLQGCRTYLVPARSEGSPCGSLLCATSVSETEESFLQDYW